MKSKLIPNESLLGVTAGDVRELKLMQNELEVNIGRILIHGELNGDGVEDIVSNIMADIKCCLIDRWAEKFLPGEGLPQLPSESGFADDEDWESEYADFGYSRN